jgi:hypothetical protein
VHCGGKYSEKKIIFLSTVDGKRGNLAENVRTKFKVTVFFPAEDERVNYPCQNL